MKAGRSIIRHEIQGEDLDETMSTLLGSPNPFFLRDTLRYSFSSLGAFFSLSSLLSIVDPSSHWLQVEKVATPRKEQSSDDSTTARGGLSICFREVEEEGHPTCSRGSRKKHRKQLRTHQAPRPTIPLQGSKRRVPLFSSSKEES